jgi:hypothetical protein
VALFSDLDWLILAAAATFLLFGRGNGEALRTLGRWYGRAVRWKQELLSEVSRAADLPLAPAGGPLSLRATLLGGDAVLPRSSGIPAAVRTPPSGPTPPPPVPGLPWTGGVPVASWSTTDHRFDGGGEVRG